MSTLKLFHVLFVFIWIGSLLSLTRLMAYQVREEGAIQLALGRVYKRFYFFIDLPSMILAVFFGLLLLFLKDTNWKAPWLHMKLTFAFLLICCDIFLGNLVVKVCRKPIEGAGVAYKIFHGVVGLLFIGVLVAIYILKGSG